MAEAVTRFWDERSKGRPISVDEALATSAGIGSSGGGGTGGTGGAGGAGRPATPDYLQTRATMIQVIASQAAVLSDVSHASPGDRETIATFVGSSAADVLAAQGPLPQIEGYDLVSCLGQGGMGAVFEGYQQSTGKRVAVKFMLDRLGASDAARQRFEREVEVVARLQHPGIVSVIDSGVRRGKYFYVMEYVVGKPIEHALVAGTVGVKESLELTVQVCDAVDYAHQRGILHRDLKPSNIIIDKDGRPHLLDFGLAKVFDPASGDGGSHGEMGLTISGPGQLLGTLAYMASEQAQGKHDETSVRTDVYALAAITYELITGRLPCLMKGSVAETLTGIIELPPAAPSSLRKGLSHDLDAVLLKGLEKAPERRYATVGELAADLRRVLAGEPVVARRVGAIGKSWRWIGRNQALSGVIAAAVVALVVVTAVLLTRVVRERDLARDNFSMLRSILEAADPEKTTGVTVVQLLDGAAKRLDDAPPERAATEAEIREIIGGVYRKFMEYDKARKNQERVLMIHERLARGADNPAVADALHNLAATLWWDGKYTEAEQLYVRSLEMRKRLHPGNDPAVAMSLTHLAACRLRMGRPNEARELYEQALEMRKALYGAEHKEVAASLNNLAMWSMETGNFVQAENLLRQALAMIVRLEGESSPGAAAASHNLGDCLVRRGEAAQLAEDQQGAEAAGEAAREPFDRALAIRTAMYAQGHHLLAGSLNGLARAELLLGKPDNIQKASDLAQRAVEMVRKTRRADHPELGNALETLGMVQLVRSDPAAVTSFEQALFIVQKTRPPAEMRVARVHRELGQALLLAGKRPQAAEALAKSLDEFRKLRGDGSLETRRTAQVLLGIYQADGDTEHAEAIKQLLGSAK